MYKEKSAVSKLAEERVRIPFCKVHVERGAITIQQLYEKRKKTKILTVISSSRRRGGNIGVKQVRQWLEVDVRKTIEILERKPTKIEAIIRRGKRFVFFSSCFPRNFSSNRWAHDVHRSVKCRPPRTKKHRGFSNGKIDGIVDEKFSRRFCPSRQP